jgi:hypothetical protein
MGYCANRRKGRVSHGMCARAGNELALSATWGVLPSSKAKATGSRAWG